MSIYLRDLEWNTANEIWRQTTRFGNQDIVILAAYEFYPAFDFWAASITINYKSGGTILWNENFMTELDAIETLKNKSKEVNPGGLQPHANFYYKKA